GVEGWRGISSLPFHSHCSLLFFPSIFLFVHKPRRIRGIQCLSCNEQNHGEQERIQCQISHERFVERPCFRNSSW
ncbi:hypothetical protein VIGAN_10030400, partial [Vigna angularis var. angularis]